MPLLRIHTSLIGEVTLVQQGDVLTHIYFKTDTPPKGLEQETDLLHEAASQIEQYLAGKRKDFNLPFVLAGTAFQQSIWRAIGEIPYGNTQSYAGIAARCGSPKASRAVGNANNRNPLPLLIPCHRVVGVSGKLVGYRGGLDVKEKLLQLEKENM